MQVARQFDDLFRLEVDQQAFGDRQHRPFFGGAGEYRASCLGVAQVGGNEFQRAVRRFAGHVVAEIVDHVRQVHMQPAQVGGSARR